ncbi:MAG: hypothetical protein KF799_04825 [Bdellovibrionales bacterium]|nr:hypothetical protein [Bdellovibrionales bacterium]
MKINARGFNLVSIVAALAVFSFLMATVSLLYKNIVEMGLQAEVSHDMDSLAHTVQDILSSNVLCNRALRQPTTPSPTGYVVWPAGGEGVIGSIQTNNGQTPPVVIVSTAAPNNRIGKVLIQSMVLRYPNQAAGIMEGSPAQSSVQINGENYDVITAKVQINFTWAMSPGSIPPNLPSGLFRPRTMDVTVSVHRPSNQVRFCFQESLTQLVSEPCNAVTSGGTMAYCTPTAPGCQIHYFLAGFDANSRPICDCRMTCPSAGSGGGSGKGGAASLFAGQAAAGALGGGATGSFGAAPGGAAAVGIAGGAGVMGAGAAGAAAAGAGGAASGAGAPSGAAGVLGGAGPYGAGPGGAAVGAAAAAGAVYSN